LQGESSIPSEAVAGTLEVITQQFMFFCDPKYFLKHKSSAKLQVMEHFFPPLIALFTIPFQR
jgi:hypothetical protein